MSLEWWVRKKEVEHMLKRVRLKIARMRTEAKQLSRRHEAAALSTALLHIDKELLELRQRKP